MSTPTTGTTISIIDDGGKLVRVLDGDKAAGSHSYTWDGKDANGVALKEGVYSIQVTGKDHDGASVEFSTRAVGKVSGVEIRDGQVLLNLGTRSEEHTSELQSLIRISYAVFCLKQKKQTYQ